jgi:hypothetical protein
VTLGPGGSVTVTGAIQCVEAQQYDWSVEVRQRTSGNVFLVAQANESGTCQTTGPLPFTFTTFGHLSGENNAQKPFHKGPAVASTFGRICTPDFSCGPNQTSFEEVRIR